MLNIKYGIAYLLGVILIYFASRSLPAYTQWAIILLILPSIFFIIAEKRKLNFKKLAVISGIGVLMGIIWDTIAIRMNIWNFPKESVIGWLLGIPIEEYVFAVCFCIVVIGIYTSLPKFRYHISDGPRMREVPLLILVFVFQIASWLWLFYSDGESYLKWLLFLAIIPSIFYLWRKGEKIDEARLGITVLILIVATIITDIIFIKSASWYHNDSALIGRIGIVPIDDILFSVFIGISVIGLYTSLPKKHIISGKW